VRVFGRGKGGVETISRLIKLLGASEEEPDF